MMNGMSIKDLKISLVAARVFFIFLPSNVKLTDYRWFVKPFLLFQAPPAPNLQQFIICRHICTKKGPLGASNAALQTQS